MKYWKIYFWGFGKILYKIEKDSFIRINYTYIEEIISRDIMAKHLNVANGNIERNQNSFVFNS